MILRTFLSGSTSSKFYCNIIYQTTSCASVARPLLVYYYAVSMPTSGVEFSSAMWNHRE